MISVQNSIKKVLYDATSNKKKQPVEYEINGWLQTYKKKITDKKIMLRKTNQNYSHVMRSLENLNSQTAEGETNKHEEPLPAKKVEVRQKRSKRNSFTIHNQPKIHKNDNKQNQNVQNTVENNEKLNKISLQISDCPISRTKTKCNSRGYVLKQLRRRLKQKSQLKNYSNNKLLCPPLEHSQRMDLDEEFEFIQKRMRMVVVHSSRSIRPLKS